MIPDDFIDGILGCGVLPGVRRVTMTDATPTTIGVFDARKEDAQEDVLAAANVQAGQEACVWFFPADQEDLVRPRNRWQITDTGGDGSTWTVIKDDLVIQQRGFAIVASKNRT